MASLVGVFAASHAPLIARAWEAVDTERRASITATFQELGRRFTDCQPDIVVVVSPDHWVNFFLNNLPSVCIGVGETHRGPPEPWLKDLPYRSVQGHADFAMHLARTALDSGFEPSLSHQMELDHGFVIPLWKMGIPRLPALVPIVINTIEPPLPSLQRCLEWGDLLRHAIVSYPASLRIAILATGGVSHSIGEADMGRIDEAFDRKCFEQMKSATHEGLLQFLQRELDSAGNGAAEMRNWLVAHAAAQCLGFELLGYHPYPEWYVGCGYAAWDLAAR